MKNAYEVLRQKELELSKVEAEVEALWMVAPLLTNDNEGSDDDKAIAAGSTVAVAYQLDAPGSERGYSTPGSFPAGRKNQELALGFDGDLRGERTESGAFSFAATCPRTETGDCDATDTP